MVDLSVFSAGKILEILKGLDKFKSKGPDEIHPFVLNSCAEVLAGQLEKI